MTTHARSLTSLLQRTTITDHEEILRACTASLKASKNDAETQCIKFVSLLKLDRYDDALRVLEEGGDGLKQRVVVERAYALYKVGELEEARNIAKGITNDRGARHVEAQAVCILPFGPAAEGMDYRNRLTRCLDGSHIGLKTSRTQPNFTGSWQGARLQ